MHGGFYGEGQILLSLCLLSARNEVSQERHVVRSRRHSNMRVPNGESGV